MRLLLSWAVALALVGVGVPKAVNISWHGVVLVLGSLRWPDLIGLVVLWLIGLYVHSFVLMAAAPSLTRRRALTLNVTGSAVANVVPLGGAAGLELNRRMMSAWGIGARAFTGYTFLINLWGVCAKLLLPILAVGALAYAGDAVIASLWVVAVVAAIGFVGVAVFGAVLLLSPRCTALLGQVVERVVQTALRRIGRYRDLDIAGALLDVRGECAALVATGWLPMSLGMAGYVAMQCLQLGFCLHLTGGGSTWAEVLAGFALGRLLTVLPITPGGVGVADLGLVGVLLALGGDPTGIAAGAVLYRAFVLAVEIPVGGTALGLWLLGRRLRVPSPSAGVALTAEPRRIAHVVDSILPRVGSSRGASTISSVRGGPAAWTRWW